MNRFIENVNAYLGERKIKNNYVSLMTGWDKSKVSRILNGDANLKIDDMEKLADALGHDMVFFLSDIEAMHAEPAGNGQVTFFAGNINEEDKAIADKLVEMFRFYDSLTLIEM